MHEWLKWQPWKGCGFARVPWVRIPPLPPVRYSMKETLKHTEDPRMDAFARQIVMMLSRDNINLQLGRFETEEDLNKRRQELSQYQF